MTRTIVSNKGQVIIPKAVRETHHWEPGQELEVLEIGNGVLLRPVSNFAPTSLEDVAGSLTIQGNARSLDDMNAAIQKGTEDRKKG